nr:segregation/condensation protein A [Bacilli bacterium]
MMDAMNQEAYQITLRSFSGPLDLLLHLIEEQQLDIHEVAIAKVTDQYLSLLKDSLSSSMEVASEFIVMAATLIAIKAKSLLPRQTEELLDDIDDFSLEDDASYDSAQDLAQKLLEYRFIKQITSVLRQYEGDQGMAFGRLPTSLEAYQTQTSTKDQLGGITMEELLARFAQMIKRSKIEINVEIIRDRETIPQRMRKIEFALKNGPLSLASLCTDFTRKEIVTVFLAILELMKINRITCHQEERFGEIWIARATS